MITFGCGFFWAKPMMGNNIKQQMADIKRDFIFIVDEIILDRLSIFFDKIQLPKILKNLIISEHPFKGSKPLKGLDFIQSKSF
jgi:hypothetical protein